MTAAVELKFLPGAKCWYLSEDRRICHAIIDKVQLSRNTRNHSSYPVTYYLDRGDSLDIPPYTLPANYLFTSLAEIEQKTATQNQLFQ